MKITELTPEQEAKFPAYVDEWLRVGLSTEPMDRPTAAAAVREIYRLIDRPCPPIAYAQSPLSEVCVGAILANGKVEDSVWASVHDSVIRSGIGNARLGCHWSAGWVAFASFFRDECGLHLPTLRLEESLARSCGRVWWHSDICVISDRPSVIKLDDRGVMHCEDGPAIAYRDGFCVYGWHGTRVPEEWITKGPDLADAIRHDNLEQRRCAAEILGWSRVLDELGATTIDAHANPLIGTLIEVDLPDVGRERFLRVMCGTRREFALPVPPDTQTATAAQAWLHHEDEDGFEEPAMRT